MDIQIGDRVFEHTMVLKTVDGQCIREYIRFEGEVIDIDNSYIIVRIDNVPVLGNGVSFYKHDELKKVRDNSIPKLRSRVCSASTLVKSCQM